MQDKNLLDEYADRCAANYAIDPSLFDKYEVKRGLRDKRGKGVVAGLTGISQIVSNKVVDGQCVQCDGELYYRGYNIFDLVSGIRKSGSYGFEEIAYLLLLGDLPDAPQLDEFREIIAQRRRLPKNFVKDVVMKAPSRDMMMGLSRSILTLAAYDKKVDDLSINNVLRQSINLIAQMPMIAVYSYHAFNHYICNDSMYIHMPDTELSTAENILRLLRPDKSYTELEAKVLDMALVLHMEHGGGNNSTFTTRVVTSSGSDTYSAISAALASLKGPKHGGANIKVVQMMRDIKENVKDYDDEDEIYDYLIKLLRKEAFDRKGLIYGMGHAVYSLSDPRALIFKTFVEELSKSKHKTKEFKLYSMIEKLAPKAIANERHIYKGVSANVDFFSGFVYNMLGIPIELYTPMFAIARIVGWSAHRLEELINADKIIRPAYTSVAPQRLYTPMEKR